MPLLKFPTKTTIENPQGFFRNEADNPIKIMWTLFKKMGRINWTIMLIMCSLLVAGLMAIYSATYVSETAEFREAFGKQLRMLPIGFALFFIIALVDYEFWIKLSIPIFAVTLVLLILVLFFGKVVNGARSWFLIAGFGIQPAEFAKISFILLIALLLPIMREKFEDLPLFCISMGLTLIPIFLIMRQPDLGSSSVFIPIVFLSLYVLGIKNRYIMPFIAAGIIGFAALNIMGPKIVEMEKPFPGLKQYQMNRLKTFIDPELDPLRSGWTINQSLIAIGSGGFFGKGYLQGTQNVRGFIGRNIAFTDFIFAVIGEETGFVGGAIVIMAQVFLIMLALHVGSQSRDATGSILTAGVAALFFTHFFINIGMTIKVVPITGIPLPFISFGGSFLLVCMSAMGLVQSVWIHRKPLERN
jgi:rod shape determining protein RodA